MTFRVLVHDVARDVAVISASRASAVDRAAAMSPDEAAKWLRRMVGFGQADRRGLARLRALDDVGPREASGADLARRVAESFACGRLLAIARPRRRVVVPLETEAPILGPEDSTTSWIEIELVDESGQPIPEEAYEIVCADGRVRSGTLNAAGRAREDGIEPGTCRVTFPGLYEWRAA